MYYPINIDSIDDLCDQIKQVRDAFEKVIEEKDELIDSTARDLTDLEDIIYKQEKRISDLEEEISQYTFVDRWEKKRHEE